MPDGFFQLKLIYCIHTYTSMTTLPFPLRGLLGYPKFMALVACCIFAYLLFSTGALEQFGESLHGHGYVSIFIAGLLFSFGFTSPFAAGLFLAMAPQVNPYIAAPLGGFAAFLADLCIFEFIRFSFSDEIHRLKSTRAFLKIHGLLHHKRVPVSVRTYLLWAFAGLIIASPLPDEIGVTLLSTITTIDAKKFGAFSFAMNTLGIFVMLMVGRGIV